MHAITGNIKTWEGDITSGEVSYATNPDGSLIVPMNACKGLILPVGNCGLYARLLEDYNPSTLPYPVCQPDGSYVCCKYEQCIKVMWLKKVSSCPIEVPVYEYDDEGELVLGEDGNPVVLETITKEGCTFSPLFCVERECVEGEASIGDLITANNLVNPLAPTYHANAPMGDTAYTLYALENKASATEGRLLMGF